MNLKNKIEKGNSSPSLRSNWIVAKTERTNLYLRWGQENGYKCLGHKALTYKNAAEIEKTQREVIPRNRIVYISRNCKKKKKKKKKGQWVVVKRHEKKKKKIKIAKECL